MLPDLCTICAHRLPPPDAWDEDACDVEDRQANVAQWLSRAELTPCPAFVLRTAPVAPVPGDVLSEDQETACTAILAAVAAGESRALVLTGPAGTGKTTLMRELCRRLTKAHPGRSVAYAAPTGKAAVRLREVTGEPAATLHSLIYGSPENRGQCPVETCGAWSKELAMSRLELRIREWTHRTCPACDTRHLDDPSHPLVTKLFFEKRQGNPEDAELSTRGILVVDEASMVDEQLHRDALEALPEGVTLLYVGDREQLPPVSGAWGPDFEHPTATLTKIHRQAEGNPILVVATRLREGGEKFPFQKKDQDREGRFRALSTDNLDGPATWLARARDAGRDATLVTYTNATRRALNARVRSIRGMEEAGAMLDQLPIVPYDRLLVRSNTKGGGFANGEVLLVTEARWEPHGRKVEPRSMVRVTLQGRGEALVPLVSFGQDRLEHLHVREIHENAWNSAHKRDPTGDLARELRLIDPELLLHADYGECLSIHASQGSQWDSVGLVWDRACWGCWFNEPATGRRLAYTAVTRAKEDLRVWTIKSGDGAEQQAPREGWKRPPLPTAKVFASPAPPAEEAPPPVWNGDDIPF